MSHLDDDALVDLALRDDAVLPDHVRDCARCRHALMGLGRVTRALRSVGTGGLVSPPPEIREAVSPPSRVWEAIEAAVGADAAEEPDASSWAPVSVPSAGEASGSADQLGHLEQPDRLDERGPAERPGPSGSGPSGSSALSTGDVAAGESRFGRSRRDRGRHAGGRSRSWLVAAAAGLMLGAVGGYLVRAPEQTPTAVPLAEVELTAAGAAAGQGRAELVRTDDGLDLRVRTDRLDAGAGYLEVWLINSDLDRMVSVGVLPENAGRSSFPVSQTLIDEGYVIVDISREPLDGQPEHSDDTLLRGALET